MKSMVILVLLIVAFIAMPLCMYAQDEGLIEESIGPRMTNTRSAQDVVSMHAEAQPEIDRNVDADHDGVPDAKDACPDTPRLVGTFDVGERFSLEDVEIRYMGVITDGVRLMQTTNVPSEEGGNQRCSIDERNVSMKMPSCVLDGLPEIEIVLTGSFGNKVELLVRHRVDETGCSSAIE